MNRFVISNQFNPFLNLAVEERLFEDASFHGVFFFLWRNERTVVIGAHQNPWTECAVDRLLADGGVLARRRTGGGAVYHDVENLNFSFVMEDALYDVNRQLGVLAEALETFGLRAVATGRNDLEIDGAKFSGNAFLHAKGRGLHHGTILIRTDLAAMARYLSPPPAKLAKRGVPSVRSRVRNLSELVPALTPETLMPAFLAAFQSEYGEAAEVPFDEFASEPSVRERAERYASEEWLYADWRLVAERPFQNRGSFSWGHCELYADLDEAGAVRALTLASDSLYPENIEQLERAFVGWNPASPLPSVPYAHDVASLLLRREGRASSPAVERASCPFRHAT